MPKHEANTPKAIANRIKAKGLQKLRWYCQLCQKQCRDENGFKCHMMSESHQRQALLVGENIGQHIYGYSKEFLDDFMSLLKRQYGTRRVSCNVVYNEYIHNRHHIHMNSTRWHTLTGFVQWLGREGLCEVEPTEKGWYIKYIDRDPVAIWKKEALEKKQKMDIDDEERMSRFIEQQIEKAESSKREEEVDEESEDVARELVRSSEDEKVSFSLFDSKSQTKGESSSSGCGQEETSQNDTHMTDDPAGAKEKGDGFARPKPPVKLQNVPNALKVAAASLKSEKKEAISKEDRKRKPSALEEIKMMEEQRKEKMNRKDYWLTEGIVVKVVSKRLGDKYYKKKAVVEGVKDHYAAVVRMLDSDAKIKIDQAHLETVIPAIGREVLVVNGAYRGLRAKLLGLDQDKFCVSMEIAEGPTRGRIVDGVLYEDVCKLHS